MTKSELHLPVGPVGRFVPCPTNNDSHVERVALEVKRTYDKNQKMRYSAHCPICNTRIFLNNWTPGPRSRSIVQAESEGLHPIGINPDHRDALLKELGLVRVNPMQQAQSGWPQPGFVPAPKRKPSAVKRKPKASPPTRPRKRTYPKITATWREL